MTRQMAAIDGTVQTNLKSWGTSRGIRIPKRLCELLGIGIGSELTMKTESDEQGTYLVIRPSVSEHRSYADAPAISMEEAFADYSGGYVAHEADWGKDVGAEVVS